MEIHRDTLGIWDAWGYYRDTLRYTADAGIHNGYSGFNIGHYIVPYMKYLPFKMAVGGRF